MDETDDNILTDNERGDRLIINDTSFDHINNGFDLLSFDVGNILSDYTLTMTIPGIPDVQDFMNLFPVIKNNNINSYGYPFGSNK